MRAALQRRGMELLSGPSLFGFLQSRQVDLVLDVGANVGQYALGLRERGYHGLIRSFEPVSDVFARLAAAAAGDRNWRVARCALGAQAGVAQINVFRNSVFNSLKPQSGLGAAFGSGFDLARVEEVEVRTLDAVMADDPAQAIFLKIDTQGFEQEVLAGGRQLLKRCVGLQLELPVEHLYEGVWSLTEALEKMREAGFAPAQIRPVTSLQDDSVSAVEFDCVFRRAA